ncbi:MAG: CPBP family intramembrane glutamic endopeptidase [Candidatus Woesearchaeota archaeon]
MFIITSILTNIENYVKINDIINVTFFIFFFIIYKIYAIKSYNLAKTNIFNVKNYKKIKKEFKLKEFIIVLLFYMFLFFLFIFLIFIERNKITNNQEIINIFHRKNNEYYFYNNQIMVLIFQILIPSLFEEIIYRYIIFENLLMFYSLCFSAIMSIVIFSISHELQFILLTKYGIFYPFITIIILATFLILIFVKYKKLIYCILIHFLHNLFVIILSNIKSLDKIIYKFYNIYLILFIILSITIIIYVIYYLYNRIFNKNNLIFSLKYRSEYLKKMLLINLIRNK